LGTRARPPHLHWHSDRIDPTTMKTRIYIKTHAKSQCLLRPQPDSVAPSTCVACVRTLGSRAGRAGGRGKGCTAQSLCSSQGLLS
jgi:hypothetical protein